jgi:outer membrane protein TolC
MTPSFRTILQFSRLAAGAAFVFSASLLQGNAQSMGTSYDPLSNTIATPHPINPAANTTNPSALAVQGQNPFLGSVPACGVNNKTIELSLAQAIDCGLRFNLGLIDSQQGSASARAARIRALSVLLPQLSATASEQFAQYSAIPTGAEKISFSIPAVGETIHFPQEVGPFNYQYTGFTVSQSLLNEQARHGVHAATAERDASVAAIADSRDIVILAVGSAYLQVVASKARLKAFRAELDAAITFDQFTAERVKEKASPEIDTIRAQVARYTAEQRVTNAETGLKKDKLTLSRVVGLPLNHDFDITDDVPYQPLPEESASRAIQQALESRSDLKSAAARLRATEETVRAASAQRLPTVAFGATYGAVGTNTTNVHETYAVGATLNIPIFTGRRIESDLASANAELGKRKAEYEDLIGRVEYDVRTALLDLESTQKSIRVAERNRALAIRGLFDTKERFRVGVSTSLEFAQAQQAVADADNNCINSLFGYNVAKLDLARAIGLADANLSAYVKGK